MKIVKNTLGITLTIKDVGIQIPASSSYTIPPQDYHLWAASSNAVTFINNGTIIINDGVKDLSKRRGLALILDNEIKTVRIINVSKDSASNAEYSSIAAAADSITDSSDTNHYTIQVAPGMYFEPEINLPPYVCIKGSTIQSTVVEPDDSAHNCINMNIGCEVSFLTIQNVGTGYDAISALDVGDYTQIHKVSFYNCYIGIHHESATQDCYLYAEYVDFNESYYNAIKIKSAGGFISFVSAENLWTFPAVCGSSQFLIDGTKSSLFVSSGKTLGDDLKTDTNFEVFNGGQLSIQAMTLDGSNVAVKTTNSGSAPLIDISSTDFKNNNTDIQILHTQTVGTISGTATFSKVVNNATSTVSLNYSDPVVGDYNHSRTMHTRGLATDITTIVTANQTSQLLNTDAHAIVTTGSSTGQIVQLPNATTLRNGHQFWIINASTSLIATRQFGGSNSVNVFPSGTIRYILRDNSTTAGIWNRTISSASPFQGTAPIICGYGGNAVATRYLEFISGNASNTSPFVAVSNFTVVGLSMGGTSASTATVTLYKNGNFSTPLGSLSLSANNNQYNNSLNIPLSTGDLLTVAITSGSINKPMVAIYLAGNS